MSARGSRLTSPRGSLDDRLSGNYRAHDRARRVGISGRPNSQFLAQAEGRLRRRLWDVCGHEGNEAAADVARFAAAAAVSNQPPRMSGPISAAKKKDPATTTNFMSWARAW